ncbi:transporter substrate-binding domain-containing protein [Candidatus Venteria ishoeyi]|uniref:substrate-binding periplasmic protein n=1 Tax=Candidatus Venteria ishoeyi TaxID=1899563 RepID=UPI0025A4EDE8|nr:transporter substrate-binding domain-containing protein [Candidatus Venteria ishoeyi]MDM8545072.1 transporter substrate-binding domain-containing protein [Candidatus Venteria ishoeyi]
MISGNLRLILLFIFYCFYSPLFAENTLPPLGVYIYDRPPLFNIKDTDNISGIIAEPTAQVFEMAKVPFRWRITSSKAVLKKLEQNTQALCGTGWFKNTEREKFAKYSLPIYQDGARVIMIRANDAAVKKHTFFTHLFADNSLKAGLKKGYSYGPYIDDRIKELSPQVVMTNQGGEGMIRMLLKGRFDYFLLIQEQAEYLLSLPDYQSQIELKTFKDIFPGCFRYILCSLKTDDNIMHRINQAITKLKLAR